MEMVKRIKECPWRQQQLIGINPCAITAAQLMVHIKATLPVLQKEQMAMEYELNKPIQN